MALDDASQRYLASWNIDPDHPGLQTRDLAVAPDEHSRPARHSGQMLPPRRRPSTRWPTSSKNCRQAGTNATSSP